MSEHLSGTSQFHDQLNDRYLYNGLEIETSYKLATISVSSGLAGGGSETISIEHRPTIVTLYELIQMMRRMQHRSRPLAAAPKPTDHAPGDPCRMCNGLTYLEFTPGELTECAWCRGIGHGA